MPSHLILASSWSTYDDYKKCIGQHPDLFVPSDAREVRFLVEKISEYYPQYTEMVIELSVHSVKRTLYGGCKRPLFVQLVLENLLKRTPLMTADADVAM